MSHFELRYAPSSDLGRRYPSWVIATFRTRETAEAVVPTCPNASSIVVIEVGESSTLQGESGSISGKIGGYSEGPDRVNESDPSRHRSIRPKGA